MSEIRLKTFQKLRAIYPFYAKRCLQIRDKDGKLVPFIFNRAQTYLHTRLEEQKRRIGKVRAVIVKGRQQGCSTYVGGRFFHRSSLNSGIGVFILAHLAESTRSLFKMVGRFYDKAPESMKPPVKVSNQRNLEFAELGSEYAIGTAGSADIGRGMTVQLCHGSEVAYWPNSDDIVTGLLQAIPDSAGSEIILESTANGIGNLFHSMAMRGLKPESEFITIFIPWFWQDEYRQEPPEDFAPTEEELVLMKLYKLSDAQIYWRRRKIYDVFTGEVWRFQREYPCSLDEAFITSGERLLPADKVALARKSNLHDVTAPVTMGVDPARKGDRTVIVLRRGREIFKKFVYHNMTETRLAGICATIIDQYGVIKCFIDVGLGYGTLDILRESGYTTIVVGIHFGSRAMKEDVYQNIRAEMADSLRQWFEDGETNILDDEEYVNELLMIPPLAQTTGRGVLALPAKKDIIKVTGKSPDEFDATILTFAFPVARGAQRTKVSRREPEMVRKRSPLATIRNFTGGKNSTQRVFEQKLNILK